MMNKTKLLLLSFVAILTVVGVTGAFAQYTAEKETVNNLKTDTVDIELKEFQLDENDSEVDYVNPDIQLPGMIVSKIPRIYNRGSECWIRVKLDFSVDDENLVPVSLDNVIGFQPDNWITGSDGYYYFTQPIQESTDIDVFKAVTIPSYWGNEYKDKNIYIDITAEAIQYKNFNPNFNSDKPWGDIKAEKCVRSRDFERKESNS